jgi:hypothetical protein
VASWRSKLTPERVAPPAEPAKGDGKDDAKNTDAPKAGGDAKPAAKPESDGETSDVTPEEGATGEEDD